MVASKSIYSSELGDPIAVSAEDTSCVSSRASIYNSELGGPPGSVGDSDALGVDAGWIRVAFLARIKSMGGGGWGRRWGGESLRSERWGWMVGSKEHLQQ